MASQRKNNLFTQVPIKPPKRSLFDLSHEVKMSGKFGYLYPVLCVDTLPGDSFRDTMNAMIRFAPMAAPVMHRFDVTTHFFFVPYRIIWDNWQDFITGGQTGTEAPVPPYYTPAGIASLAAPEAMMQGSLWDYLGLPVAPITPPVGWSTEQISALPFWAVAKVFNDYYRDPNLNAIYSQGPNGTLPIPQTLDGNVDANSDAQNILFGLTQESDYSYLRRGFEKDYFTSALPWAQRGAQVLMPMQIVVDRAEYASGAPLTISGDIMHNTTNNLVTDADGAPPPGGGQLILTGENATTTMNDFRRALALQRWMEANARGGARYTEQIKSHFNETVPDFRLMRAEYIGGGKQPVQISEVLATAETDEGPQIGDMYGHGLSVGRTNKFTYKCQEHGVVLGFLSVTMRTAYSQGIPKMFSRTDKYDFGWPELAHLGEQEIKSKEVFYSFDGTDDDDNNILFGYIPRYAEYKFMNDRIAGDFRGSLSFWHEGRKFTERPVLDNAFTTIFENGDSPDEIGVPNASEESFRRIFNVNNGTDYLWMQLYHHLTVKRPLPYFGVPSI